MTLLELTPHNRSQPLRPIFSAWNRVHSSTPKDVSSVFRKVEQPSLLDVLDRILDKGIVVDAWIRFSLVGLDLLTVDARIVVASIETYLKYAGELQNSQLQSRPARGLALVSSPDRRASSRRSQ